MKDSSISYIISSIAPDYINTKMWKIRKKFNALPAQERKFTNSFITLDTAHITIKRRFHLKNNVNDQLIIKALNKIDRTPISIKAYKLAMFNSKDQGNIIVAILEKNGGLQKLHDEVLHSISPYIETSNEFEGNSYTPHLSLMYNIPEDSFEKVKQYAEKIILPIEYKLNNFYILKNIQGIKKEREIVKAYTFISNSRNKIQHGG